MLDPTNTTWALLVFGWLFIFLPILVAQVMMIARPHSRRTKNLLIAKDEEWRDKTHFKSTYGIALADLLLWLPLMLAGSIGVVIGQVRAVRLEPSNPASPGEPIDRLRTRNGRRLRRTDLRGCVRDPQGSPECGARPSSEPTFAQVVARRPTIRDTSRCTPGVPSS